MQPACIKKHTRGPYRFANRRRLSPRANGPQQYRSPFDRAGKTPAGGGKQSANRGKPRRVGGEKVQQLTTQQQKNQDTTQEVVQRTAKLEKKPMRKAALSFTATPAPA
jgi:hypothetical protein